MTQNKKQDYAAPECAILEIGVQSLICQSIESVEEIQY